MKDLDPLEQHIKDDMEFHKSETQFHAVVAEDIRIIKENHLTHIQADMNVVKTDVKWLIKAFWILFAAAVGVLIKAFTTL